MLKPSIVWVIVFLIYTGNVCFGDNVAVSSDHSHPRVRFLVVSDPRFDNNPAAEMKNRHSFNTLRNMGRFMEEEPDISGLVVIGSLTSNACKDELAMYQQAIAGFDAKVYDSIGNHDEGSASWYRWLACPYLLCCASPNAILEHLNRTRQTPARNALYYGAIYSWDWQDIHFVQMGFSSSDSPSPDGNSYKAVDFLQHDLQEQVGDSGRSVILVMHDFNDSHYYRKLRQLLEKYRIIAILYKHAYDQRIWFSSSSPAVIQVASTQGREDYYLDIVVEK